MLKIIAPYMRAGFKGELLFLGLGSIHCVVSDKEIQEIYLHLLDYWAIERVENDVYQYLIDKGFKSEIVKATIEEAIEKNYIINSDFYDRANAFSRNHLFYTLLGNNPHEVQKRLEKKHVLILGCGGIGNLISVSLATAGIGQLTLVDDDKIERSNLNRQFMFTKHDIGNYKSITLKQALLDRTDNVSINTFEQRVSVGLLNIIGKVDLIVLSADSSDCMPLVNAYCTKNEIAYLNICYVQDIPVWGPFYIPGKTGCFSCQNNLASSECNNNELSRIIDEINNKAQPPSNAGINMLASSLGFLDILKFLGEFGDILTSNTRIGLMTQNLTVTRQNYEPNKSCKICSAYSKQEQTQSYMLND